MVDAQECDHRIHAYATLESKKVLGGCGPALYRRHQLLVADPTGIAFDPPNVLYNSTRDN